MSVAVEAICDERNRCASGRRRERSGGLRADRRGIASTSRFSSTRSAEGDAPTDLRAMGEDHVDVVRAREVCRREHVEEAGGAEDYSRSSAQELKARRNSEHAGRRLVSLRSNMAGMGLNRERGWSEPA